MMLLSGHIMECSAQVKIFDLTFGLLHTVEKICRDPGEDSFYDSK